MHDFRFRICEWRSVGVEKYSTRDWFDACPQNSALKTHTYNLNIGRPTVRLYNEKPESFEFFLYAIAWMAYIQCPLCQTTLKFMVLFLSKVLFSK